MRQKEAKAKKGEGKKSEGKFSAGKKVENKQQQSNNGRRGPKTAQPGVQPQYRLRILREVFESG